jgi:hypothetical protein
MEASHDVNNSGHLQMSKRRCDTAGQDVTSAEQQQQQPEQSRQSEQQQQHPAKKRARIVTPKKKVSKNQPAICLSLLRLDPILQFLTRAGKAMVNLNAIKATLPSADDELLKHIQELANHHGVLHIVGTEGTESHHHSDAKVC